MNKKTKKPGQKLGFFMSVALVMGNMIGSGVFLLPQSLAPFGWNAIAGWVITIAGALCLAHVLAKLTAAHKGAIGPSELVERSFGPVAGFLIGFSFWVSVWTGCVTIAVGATSYMSSFLPILGEYPALAALGVIWTMTGVNLLGVRSAGSFQVVTTLLKLTPLIVVAVLIGMIFGREGTAALAPFPAEGLSLPSVNTAAAMTLWAMIGFEAACAASHKIDNPQRNVPRATFYGALLSGIIYLIVCSGITLMLPADKVAASPAPFELFVSTFWSPGPASFVAAFAAISAIGAVNGWTLVQGELPLEMAKRQMMPVWFARVTANGVPINGLLSATVLGSLLVLANSSQSMAGLFSFMALLTTSVTLWLYLACAAVALKRKIAVPFALLGLVFGVWSLWGAGLDASGLSIVLMLAGLPLYWWTRRSLPKNDRSANTS
ncbi:MAG: amino acid permease [Sphingorhabdus sp.]|uniref:amino acid permease n=1 Tax=Sphingorhabdus sp. TaxID=1902408 RepID=UPI003C967DC5